MSDKQIKQIRSQIRNVVKEILPEVLEAELKLALYKDLSDRIHIQLSNITKHVKDTLDRIDERSKNIQTYAVNQSAAITPPALGTKNE